MARLFVEPGRLTDELVVIAGEDHRYLTRVLRLTIGDRLTLFDGVAVSHPAVLSVGQEDHAERVWGELVSGNFFAVLGVKPERGRLFLPTEYGDAPGAYPVAVISDRYWRSHYGADPSIVGKAIRVNQHELTVVGVAAPAFHGSIHAD